MWLRLIGLFLLFSSGCTSCSKSPDDFALLPKEAQLLAFFDAAQLRNTKLWEAFWEKPKKDEYFAERLDTVRTFLSLDIFNDIQTVSVAAWLEGTMQPQLAGIARLSSGANALSFQESLQAQSTKRKEIGGASFSYYQKLWVSLLDGGEVLFGTERGVERALLVKQKQAESALQNERLMALREQVGLGQFFIVADVPPLVGAGAAFFLSQAKMPGTEGLAGLAGLSSVVVNLDFYHGVLGEAKVRVADEAAATSLANQPLLQGLSGLGSLYFLRNMDSWLRSEARGQDWVIQVSIPTRQASRILIDTVFYLDRPPTYIQPSFDPQEVPPINSDIPLPITEPYPP